MFSRSPRYSTWCLALKTDSAADQQTFPVKSFRVPQSVTASILTCSPPSLSAALSHWVWCSGCNAACTSSACSPGRSLVSARETTAWDECAAAQNQPSTDWKALTLIFELAVVGLPFLSVLRFSGNKLRMKLLKRHVFFNALFFLNYAFSATIRPVQETHNSLLCMSSMRSGKSTSRFLSQKPLISYDTCDDTRYFHWKTPKNKSLRFISATSSKQNQILPSRRSDV